MNIDIEHAAYISDVPEDHIRDIVMTGLYQCDSLINIDTIMIPMKDIQNFLNSYPGLEEFLRARYRIIYKYLSLCISEINNKTGCNNDIQHIFFKKGPPKETF